MNEMTPGMLPRFALAATLALSLALLSCAGKQTPRDQITDPGELIFNGLVVAEVECYKCHGGDGLGTWRGDNLAEGVPKMTEAAITRTILEGPGLMPSFKGKLDDAQLAAVTAWLHNRFR